MMNKNHLPSIKTLIPGPRSKALAKRLKHCECSSMILVNDETLIVWARAKGANVWDVDGNRYIDLTAAFAVANAGHTNPRIVQALVEQAKKFPHGPGDIHPAEIKIQFLEALSKICPKPLDTIMLGCAGSEAVEIAMKTAFLATGKPGLIVFEGSYHGLTYGALCATSLFNFYQPFESQLSHHTYRLPFPHKEKEKALLHQITQLIQKKSIGAILIEAIQGRGGIRALSTSFLKDLRKICDHHKIILITDEIFSGMGRTGQWFAFQHSGIIPDLVTVGKGLSGGFPISACIGSSSLMKVWPRHHGEALHTSTFMGHPIGCAMALASIQEIKHRGLVKRARIMGEKLIPKLEKLQKYPVIGEIRGRGLMIGIEIIENKNGKSSSEKAQKISHRALQKGVILFTEGVDQNILAMTPPLTISDEQLNDAVKIIEECIREIVKQ
ncbi:MAG: aspartate aminotransferase family protein [Chlamydiae bacterium]|nr:aspartate aminotransferase family protein [Chlamydiota bacterium]MBI3276662.1 aspartate aminotransferase family protein [Chlamydiota bacterium]